MGYIIPFDMKAIFLAMVVIGGITMTVLRVKASKKPTNAKKILIPPLGMSTGFLMFIYPPTHIPISWALIAFLTGMIFLASPLILTSKFQVIDGEIYLKKSNALIGVLALLLILRLGLHGYIEQHISLFKTASLFFILAFGMLLPWRLAMYYQYKKLKKQLTSQEKKVPTPLS